LYFLHFLQLLDSSWFFFFIRMLCYSVLNYPLLNCTTQCHDVQSYTILCYAILYYATLYYIMLSYAMQYAMFSYAIQAVKDRVVWVSCGVGDFCFCWKCTVLQLWLGAALRGVILCGAILRGVVCYCVALLLDRRNKMFCIPVPTPKSMRYKGLMWCARLRRRWRVTQSCLQHTVSRAILAMDLGSSGHRAGTRSPFAL
jgi:hypothetical protein